MNDPTGLTRLQQATPAPSLSLAEAELLLNERFLPPRFRLQRELPGGGLSQVFLVDDQELQRQAVVKFTDTLLHEPLPVSCEHAHVPPIYDSGIAGGLRWTLQRYIPGESLDQVMRDEPNRLSLAARVRIVQTIADTLAAAHERGVVHLDVKPGNILLGAHGDCALIDWDGASGSGSQRALQGTPGFMAPEQAAGKVCDHRADIFALGATLLQLLTGHRPDRLPTDFHWPSGRRWRGLQAICARAMAKQVEQRYVNMVDFSQDCQHWLDDEALSVLPDPWWRPALRWLRQQRLAALAIILALLTGTALLLLWRWQQGQRQRHWQTLLQEHFDAPLSSDHWQSWVLPDWDSDSAETRPLSGERAPWLVADGSLQARLPPTWFGCADLAYTALSDTDLRLRWTVTPIIRFGNINVVFGAHRGQGQTLHIGGYNEPDLIKLTDAHMNPLAVARFEPGLQAGRDYHLDLRYHSGAVQLHINDQAVFSYQPPPGREPRHLAAIAFDATLNQLQIDDLRMERLRLPKLIDQEQLADLLEARGDHASALLLLESLPVQTSTILAQARCLRAIGRHHQAIELLRQGLHRMADDQLRLLLADILWQIGRTEACRQELEQLHLQQADAIRALHLLDDVLQHQLTTQLDLRDRSSVAPAARNYAAAWSQWLQHWHLNLRSWDPQLLPQGLRERTDFLTDLLQHDLVQRQLAPIHPILDQHHRSFQGPPRNQADPIPANPVFPPASDLPEETREERAFQAAAQALQAGTVLVRTQNWHPVTLRQSLNTKLLRAAEQGDLPAVEQTLLACRQAVRFAGYLLDEAVFPAAVLLTLGQEQRAREWLRSSLSDYPDDYRPDRQAYLRALLADREPPSNEVFGNHAALATGLHLDWHGEHQAATAAYASAPSDMLHWQTFVTWRRELLPADD
jgi:serine/threonine protein kinase/tetratricopeptide (TPR) repeat protein